MTREFSLNRYGLSGARDLLRKGDISSVDLTNACLTAIEEAGALNAFVHKTPEIALERAAAADKRLAAGDATTGHCPIFATLCGPPSGAGEDSLFRQTTRWRVVTRLASRSDNRGERALRSANAFSKSDAKGRCQSCGRNR